MRLIVLTAALLFIAAGPAAAQTCSDTDALKFNAISSALGGKWACAKDGTDMWNEQITTANSGTFKECHSGLTTGPDPIDNNKGTFSITNNTGQTPDTITYNYPPSGGSYTYRVYQVTAGSTYTFCRVSPNDGKTYTVRITTCPPPTLNNCP